MNYQQAAQTAIQVQDASNLSGVVHSFNEVMGALWLEAHRLGKGTGWVNQHPIVTMFLDKMASLNRTQCLCSENIDNVHKATTEVEDILIKPAQAEPIVAAR
jgi:hypothetical protein